PVWIGVSTCLIAGLMIAPMRLNAESPTREPLPHPKFEGFPHSMEYPPQSPAPSLVLKRKDAWVIKLDQNHNKVWKKLLGTSSEDVSSGVATDSSGNVLISGLTAGTLGGPNTNKANRDAWVAKYSPEGTLLWTKQLGSDFFDVSYGVATDSGGNVLISGWTDGGKIGDVNKGRRDAFVAAYSPDGKLLWKRQGILSTDRYDYSLGVAADGSGNTFISGYFAPFR
ncbi:MAG: SBBP repeat-containing protein, partial [Thermosynechococcaceae cyanobacterium]